MSGQGNAPRGGIYRLGGKVPHIADDVFIAPGSSVIGDVTIGAGSSIWFNCVLRGDVEAIRIGTGTNIQDGTVIHVTSAKHGTHIGNDVLVGHMALLHGCTVEDRGFIGMGAIVMDACVVESEAMVAAGALLTPGKRVKAGELWAGRPAKLVRVLDEAQRREATMGAVHYRELAQFYRRDFGPLPG